MNHDDLVDRATHNPGYREKLRAALADALRVGYQQARSDDVAALRDIGLGDAADYLTTLPGPPV